MKIHVSLKKSGITREIKIYLDVLGSDSGGGGGIRTLGTVSHTAH